MKTDLGYVHCASEERAKRFFKIKWGDLHGRLEAWPDVMIVDGKKQDREFHNCRKVEPLYIRPPMLGVLLIALAVVGISSVFSGLGPKVQRDGADDLGDFWTGVLISKVLGFILVAIGIRFLLVFRWVRLHYLDPDGTPQTVCFSQSNVTGGTLSHVPFGFRAFEQRIADAVGKMKPSP